MQVCAQLFVKQFDSSALNVSRPPRGKHRASRRPLQVLGAAHSSLWLSNQLEPIESSWPICFLPILWGDERVDELRSNWTTKSLVKLERSCFNHRSLKSWQAALDVVSRTIGPVASK